MKKRSIAASLAAVLFVSSVLLPCQTDNVSAAGRIRVSKTKVTVIKGEQVTVRAKNTGSRKIKARISNKKIASVKVVKKKIRITGKKQGKTKVTLTASHMKKCVIRVSVIRDDGGELDTVIPTTTPTRRPSSTPYMQSTARPTVKPTVQPTRTPMVTETVIPSVTPEVKETLEPTETIVPTSEPLETVNPTMEPQTSEMPLPEPTETPNATVAPSPSPAETPDPTSAPSPNPTETPDPTSAPSPGPTEEPNPTIVPSTEPTGEPQSSETPLPIPTVPPTATPKASATAKPTTAPTVPPTATPKASATVKPTTVPTTAPITTLATTRLCYGDQSLYIGESLESLTTDWGEPDRMDPLPQKNMTGYIYNSNSTTAPYLLVGISDQKVIFYFTVGKGFTAYDATVNTADSIVVEQTKLVQEGAGAASLEEDGWEEPGLYEFDALDSDQGEAKVGTEAYYCSTDSAQVYAFSDYFDGGDKSVYGFYAFSSQYTTKYDMMYRSRMTYNDDILRAMEKQVWEMTNAYRNYMGMTNLQWDSKAENSARKHSQDMAENNYFAHNSQDGTTCFQRMKAEGISYHMAGENICCGSPDAIGMVIGWIGSSGHRKGILLDVKYIGVGVAYSASSDYGTYATQDFWG